MFGKNSTQHSSKASIPFIVNKSNLGNPSKELDMLQALEKLCNRSNDYFGKIVNSPSDLGNLTPMDQLAHKCVSLRFLIEFYEQVVQPYRPDMTVKQIQLEIIMPATKEEQCSFIDKLLPSIYVRTLDAFISHAFDNPLRVMVDSLKSHFKDAVFEEIYIWIDIFLINQHKPGQDLHGGDTLKATIEASGSVVVCLDKNTVPLTRLWCLYEIGKLILLTHGFIVSEFGLAYEKIDATSAECFEEKDKTMIREHIKTMMVEQNLVDTRADIIEALTVFSRVLKLLLILKPMSYSVDIATLLDRAIDYNSYPLRSIVEPASMGGLICIVGGSGEGKSTLAAALVKSMHIDAYHFCKKTDIRRQDRGLIIRSISYQLAIKHPDFANALLIMTPKDVEESLSDDVKAWKLLLQNPLSVMRNLRVTILIDALDESDIDCIIKLLVDVDNILAATNRITFIVTTRPEPALLSPLRSHWTGDRYVQFSPSELRGEPQAGDEAISPLLRTLNGVILNANTSIVVPRDINTAYGLIFDRGVIEQHCAVLEVILASYQPQALSDLKAMGMLDSARSLPGYGTLFLERDNKLHLLHRSIAEWLLEHDHGAVDVKNGHVRLASHIWETLQLSSPLPTAQSSVLSEPSTGSYSFRYALDHLREAGRFADIQTILFRLPWLQASLREKGLSSLIKDILSLMDTPMLSAAANKLLVVLRLSSTMLLGRDAWKYLPAQLLGRLRETDDDPIFHMLRKESDSFTCGNWLKPLQSSLTVPGSLELTMIGHERKVVSAVILPDGRLASCSEDCDLRIWDAATGNCVRVLTGHVSEVHSLVALPGGRIVSCSYDSTLRIWNTTTGDCERVLSGHKGRVYSILILPDGRIVSCSYDETLRIWNPQTGFCELVLSGHKGVVTSVAILSDIFIVSGSEDKTLRVWNTTTGYCERQLSGHDGAVTSIVILPDARIISCSNDKTLRVWNTTTGNCDCVLSGHEDAVTSVAILPDTRIVSCSVDGTLSVWNTTTGHCDQVLYGHEDAITSIAVLDNRRIASCSNDKTLRIWNFMTGHCDRVLYGHEDAITSIAVLDNRRIASCSYDKALRIWSTLIGDDAKEYLRHYKEVRSVHALPDGRVISCSDDETLCIWNTLTGNCDTVLSGHTGAVTSMVILSDDRIVSCSDDSTLRIWNFVTGDFIPLLGHEAKVISVEVLSDNRIVSCSDDWTLRIWNVISGDCVKVLQHDAKVSSVAVLPDSRLISGSYDFTVRIWNILTGDFVNLPGHNAEVTSVAVLPDDRLISGSYDKTVRIWNVTTGECLQELFDHRSGVESVVVLSDGGWISQDLDKTCMLWMPDGKSKKIALEEYWERKAAARGSTELSPLAQGYSIQNESFVYNGTFGRVFVDGAVDRVVKAKGASSIAVFQKNGRVHWFLEVSD